MKVRKMAPLGDKWVYYEEEVAVLGEYAFIRFEWRKTNEKDIVHPAS